MFKKIAVSLAAAIVAFSSNVALAQDDFDTGADARANISPIKAAEFSKQIERDLAAKGARVAVVFRSGMDREKLPKGIRYTHGAFWVYQALVNEDGEEFNGYAVYNLYNSTEKPQESYLEQDFPINFALPMKVEEVGVIVPTPEIQRRILAVMASSSYSALHEPAYSLISNPHDARYQNCNEFMLDVISAGIWETDDRAQLKANLGAAFKPTKIEANVFERFFAPIVDRRLITKDHRGKGGLFTTTFSSLGGFMSEYNFADAVYELQYQGSDGAE